MDHRLTNLLCLLVLSALAFSACAEGDLLGTGVNYTIISGQALYNGLCASGTTPDQCGVEIVASEADSLPRLYGINGDGAVRGIYARAGCSDLFLTPAASSVPVNMDFLLLDSGAAVDVRLWESEGEVGFVNNQNSALILAQIKDEDDNVLSSITISALNGDKLNGECIVYRSKSSVIRVSGQGQSLFAAPVESAEVIARAKWSYDARTQNLTASALDAEGKYNGISYYAFVNDIILISGRNTETASGTIKASSGDDWRLRIVFPESGIVHSPIYHIDGTISTLADGKSYQTQLESEAPAETSAPLATPYTGPTATPTPRPSFVSSGTTLPIPAAETPYELSGDDTPLYFSSASTPEVHITITGQQIHVEILSLPIGYKQERLTLIQKRTDGFAGINMQNGYTDDSWFTLDNADSSITLTLYLESTDGKSSSVSCGSYTFKAR